MDVADGVGQGEDQQVVVAAHVADPVLEALAAIAGLVQLQLLDHRAHGAVEHEDTLARPPFRAARVSERGGRMLFMDDPLAESIPPSNLVR